MKIKNILRTILLGPAFLMMGAGGAVGAGVEPNPDTGAEVQAGIPDSGNSDQTQNSGKPEKTFTQAEVNALMAKEKDQGRRAILKELGVTDVKSAKDGLDKYKEYIESQKTELQKAQDAVGQAEKDKIDLQQQLNDSNQRLTVLMSGCNPNSVTDVCVLARARVTESVTFEQAIEKIKSEYPDMFSGEAQSRGTGSNVSPQNKGTGTAKGFGQRLASQHKTEAKNPYFNS